MAHRTRIATPHSLPDLRWAVHRANLSLARATPGEQPYVVGWEIEQDETGLMVVLDVDDDADRRRAWMAYVDGEPTERIGTLVPEEAEVWVQQLELDPRSQEAQLRRDGLVDRFHATPEATAEFVGRARSWLTEGVLFALDTAGVRTWWPETPCEPPLEQTLTDVRDGYGGPVGYAVTAVLDEGWRRVQVEALGTVTWSRWPSSTEA